MTKYNEQAENSGSGLEGAVGESAVVEPPRGMKIPRPEPRLRSRRTYSFDVIPRERSDIIHRSQLDIRIDKQAIIETACDHNRYVVRGTTLRNLPIYDDCRMYDVAPEKYASLLEKEVLKLIAFAESKDFPAFSSQGSLGGVGRADFESLSGLADQMSCNLSVLTQDNSRHGLEVPAVASEAWDALIKSRQHLRARYAQDTSGVEGRQPATLPNPQDNKIAYHSLLDYIIGLMSWWLLRSAHSEYWEKHLLAILAPQAVKMKVIAADPIKFAKTTLSATHMTIEKLKFEAEFKAELIKVGGKDRDLDLLQAEDDLSNTYFEEKFFLRQHLGNIFEAILEILTNREKSGDEAETFEICSMIHRSGLGGVTNIITGLRNGSIVASSNLQHINFCCSIFDFLKANTTRIVDAEQSTASLSPEESLRDHVTVHMTYNNGREGSKKDISDSKVRVYTMDNAVSLMVPLALINSTPAREVAILRDLTNMLADANDPIRQFAPPPRHFAIEYTISTKSWISKWQHNKKSMDPDIQKLYQSPLRRGVLPVDDCTHPEGHSATSPISTLLSEYLSNVQTMSNWEISASSITVKCRTYVVFMQIMIMVIILGSIALPFTVRDRIKGVDPFQITTFSWLLSGALLVIAKSRYVSSWPWHDFLRGVVVCSTVSDLSDVSGVDAQVILLFLLHNEWNTLLVSDGPYNGMFQRKTDPRSISETKNKEKRNEILTYRQGFSIDVPVNLTTMHGSGLVVLKAMNNSGEHLVCIDGRKGGMDGATQGERKFWMTCPGFNRDDLENYYDSGISDYDISKKVHMLQRESLSWTKILGVYVKDSKFG